MSEPLITYLHDHLAGASFAIDLVTLLRDAHSGEPLGGFAAQLLEEIAADRAVLQRIAEQLGAAESKPKETAAWLAEKAGRLKLRGTADAFGTFQALELLATGITGKRLLWVALRTAVASDPRLAGIDFDELAARAEEQYAGVEKLRLEAARAAFRAARP